MKGQLSEAIAEYRKAAELDDDPFVLALLGRAPMPGAGRRDEASKILAQLQPRGQGTLLVFSLRRRDCVSGLGDQNRAMDELESGYRGAAAMVATFTTSRLTRYLTSSVAIRASSVLRRRLFRHASSLVCGREK